MQIATISQTKNNLSAYLDLVRQGETVIIMDRNQPIAKIEPIGKGTKGQDEAHISKLERSGILRRATNKLSKLLNEQPPKLSSGASALAELLKEREETR